MCEMFGTFTTPYIIPRWVEHRVTLMTFLFLLGLSTFLIGPFYGGMHFSVMLIGLITSGLCLGPLVIPNMIEMMNATQLRYPDCDMEHASSLLSGILNCCMGMGMALGPIMGGYLEDRVGFAGTFNILGGLLIMMALLYFICAGGFEAFNQTRINYAQRSALLSQSTIT